MSEPNFILLAWESWRSGGWLMLPLLGLTLFVYYTASELLVWLSRHILVRNQLHRMDNDRLAQIIHQADTPYRLLAIENPANVREVNQHFNLLRKTYLPPIDRRIRFLAALVTAGPLLGLLGTVVGMLAAFNGMANPFGNQLDIIVEGISKALITTQTGLIMAIPAMVLIALIMQRRQSVERALARLESYHMQAVKNRRPLDV